MKKLNQKGFTAVEIAIVIVVVAVLAGVGFYVWHTQHNKSSNNSVASTQANSKSTNSSTYAGWKTYQSSYEGLTFKYPSNWKLAVTPNPVSNGAVNNGNVLTITSPDSFVIHYEAPSQDQGGGPTSKPLTVDQVIKLGVAAVHPLYLVLVDYSGYKNLRVVDGIGGNYVAPKVGQTTNSYYPSFASRSHASQYISFWTDEHGLTYVGDTGFNNRLSDAQYLASPDVKTAELIFKSLSY